MPKRSLIFLLALSTLSGCATSTAPGVSQPIPESLLQECPAPQPLPNGSHAEVERWAVESGYAYRDCAADKQALHQAVRKRQPQPKESTDGR